MKPIRPIRTRSDYRAPLADARGCRVVSICSGAVGESNLSVPVTGGARAIPNDDRLPLARVNNAGDVQPPDHAEHQPIAVEQLAPFGANL